MLARRFLGCITFLVLAAVALAFAYFQFADRAIQAMGTPQGHYQAPVKADGPDYADLGTTWLATPASDAPIRQWAGRLSAPTSTGTPRAAVFYVHPTTYLATDRWIHTTLEIGASALIGYRFAPWRGLELTPYGGLTWRRDVDLTGRLPSWSRAGVAGGLTLGWLF